jgi:hypothetical protein
MKVVISQPRYLPAINYLQRLRFANLFIVLDTVQRQSRGWENRNQILSDGKRRWLTVPISSSSRELIKDTQIAGTEWIAEHKQVLRTAYEPCPFFEKEWIDQYYEGSEAVYRNTDGKFSKLIVHLLKNACALLGFEPRIAFSSEMHGADEKAMGPNKLVALCEAAKAETYVSGPNGREYGIMDAFAGSHVQVCFHDFIHPVYVQTGQASFAPFLSFFDVLCNAGLEKTKEWVYAKPVLTEV